MDHPVDTSNHSSPVELRRGFGVVAGISNAINNGYESWGPLFGKLSLFFAFWVIIHLYPFLKGLVGRQNRTSTIVIVCLVYSFPNVPPGTGTGTVGHDTARHGHGWHGGTPCRV
jgi:hypothetical protein